MKVQNSNGKDSSDYSVSQGNLGKTWGRYRFPRLIAARYFAFARRRGDTIGCPLLRSRLRASSTIARMSYLNFAARRDAKSVRRAPN